MTHNFGICAPDFDPEDRNPTLHTDGFDAFTQFTDVEHFIRYDVLSPVFEQAENVVQGAPVILPAHIRRVDALRECRGVNHVTLEVVDVDYLRAQPSGQGVG